MTIAELIEHLKTFPANATVIMTDDGNTHGIEESDISIWNEADEESPVAIYF